MKPLKVFLLVATSIFLFGCAGGPIKTATKFTSYKDFQPWLTRLMMPKMRSTIGLNVSVILYRISMTL